LIVIGAQSHRQDIAVVPPTPERLENFPYATITKSKVLYRAHQRRRGPWFFSSDGSGRFDLLGPTGTCYLAESAVAALRESLGIRLVNSGSVEAVQLDNLAISRLQLPRPIKAADTTAPTAVNHGITREICTITPYHLPQEWAQAWAATGHGGVRYLGRLSSGMTKQDRCLAVFGAAGAGSSSYLTDSAPLAAQETALLAGMVIIKKAVNYAALMVVPAPRPS